MILDSTGKIFPDSGFHGQNVSDSGIHEQSFSDSGIHEQNFSHSGFHEQNFSDSGIQIPLHGAICSCGYTKGLGTTELTHGTCRRHVTRLQPGSPQMTAHKTWNTLLQMTSILTKSGPVFVVGSGTGL